MKLTILKNNPLVTLPTLAYFLLHFDAFKRLMLLDYMYVFILFSVIILLDIALLKINKSERTLTKTIITLLYVITILFWFTFEVTHNIHITVKDNIHHPYYRARIWAILFIIFTIAIQVFLESKKSGNYFQNIFWTILCIILLPELIPGKSDQEYEKVSNFPKRFANIKKDKKSTLLLILDEYSSPEELYKLTKSNSEFKLASALKNKGWIVKTNFKTKELYTIYSLASMFHYDISSKKEFVKTNDLSVNLKYYLNPPTLIDSLTKKNINIINYGIFHMGQKKPISNIFFYPTNFFELITSYTGTHVLINYINNGTIKLMGLNSLTTDEHNKYLFKKIPEVISTNRNSSFIYAHLFMPHSPFRYDMQEFNKSTPLNNYIDFWRFSNEKVLELIEKIKPDKNLRMIITGDHGLRGYTTDPYATFAAFWGFNEEDLKQVESVQDLGSLINAYY